MYEMTTPLIQKDVTLRQPDSETIATLYPLEKSPSFGKAPGPTGTDIDNRSLCDWSKKKKPIQFAVSYRILQTRSCTV